VLLSPAAIMYNPDQKTDHYPRAIYYAREGGNMKRLIPLLFCALWIGLMAVASASAHHSVQSQFDVHKTVTVSGTVAKLEWINPHSYLTLNVKDADGKVQKWAFELGGTISLRKAGLSRADRGGLKPGDEVTATALAARDGSNSGFLQELKVSDGRVFKFATDPNGN
jgi:hypothetical protein